MGGAALLSAWVLSVAPFVLGGLGVGEESFGSVPRSLLAWLPWLALGGLPRSASAGHAAGHAAGGAAPGPGPLREGLLALAVALPPVALAARIDVSLGVPPGRVAELGAMGALFLVALVAAAGRARTEVRARAIHGFLWLALVAGPPLLHASLRWAAAEAGRVPGRWLEHLAGSSPLGWWMDHGARLAAEGPGVPWRPWLVCALLLLVRPRSGGSGASREPGGSAP